MRRLLAGTLLLVPLVAVSLAQPPGGPGRPPGAPSQAPPGRPPGGPPAPFPGDTMAAERDSLMNEVMKSIAGKEQVAAESVFKDIQIFKGRRAGDIPRIMNFGFGRSLGASCFHCHSRGDWARDEKPGKRVARDMSRMVAAINNDHLSKIEELVKPSNVPGGPERRPTVNCGTCHRGSIHTNPEMARGGPPRQGPPSGGGR